MRQNWNLETLYDEEHFDTFLLALQKQIFEIEKLDTLREKIALAQEIRLSIRQASSFAACLLSANVDHRRAPSWEASLTSIESDLEKIWMEIDRELINIPDSEIEKLGEPEIHYALRERRDLARKKLTVEQEKLISDLSINGYHSWGQIYESFINKLSFPFQDEKLSAGRIANKLFEADRSVRQEAFTSFTNVYEKEAPLIAQILNNLAGYRLKVYEHRNWQSAIEEPLTLNRMSNKTLNAMWEAVTANRHHFADYLKCKAKLLGLEKLSWCDLDAPLPHACETIPYEKGAKFITEQFAKYSPKMADFAKRALESEWIEAEDRPGKRHGGFCIDFPLAKESRIFMTYSGTLNNVSTLAHELGHAFHSDQIFDLPEMAQHYRMNVAETASTMAEMIVSDASLQLAKNDEDKLMLLDDKVNRSVAFLLNLHTRFLFESRFYEKRQEKYQSPEELSALMLEAQQECYGDALADYHPTFWASKLHFFLTEVPFYNFPYTFGYLFSLGIYQRLKKDPSAFESAYIPLLHDTGMMSTEELAQKHFGIDLEDPAFWNEAVASTVTDVKNFLDLAERESVTKNG